MSAPLRRLRETPRHLLVCERSHVRHERSRHAARVRGHAYNCRVSFLIPECGVLPEPLKSVTTDMGEYYLVKNLPLHELVAQEFISAFVKTGSCYALSYNTRIDQDNTAALLPTDCQYCNPSVANAPEDYLSENFPLELSISAGPKSN